MFQQIKFSSQSLTRSLFQSNNNLVGKKLNIILNVLLFIFGLVVWLNFLNFGNTPKDRLDWLQITYPRLGTLQEAIRSNQIPLHIADPQGVKDITDRFLSIPDLILSPDILLLGLFEINLVILIHVIFCYVIGFYGLIRLKRKFQLSFTAFFPFFLLFNFNGFLISHLAVGHLTWAAYFFLPYFIELVWELFNKNLEKNRWIFNYSLLQFSIFLFGGYHFFVWISYFLILLLVFMKKHRKLIFMSLVVSCFINAYRIFPASLLSNQIKLAFHTSFSSTEQLIQSLISSYSPSDVVVSPTSLNVKIWELDFYIGLFALVFISFLVYQFFKEKENTDFLKLILPMLFFTLFCVGNFYLPLFNSGLPIISGERVFSRFLIMPLLFFIIIASIQYQKFITEKATNFIWMFVFWVINLLIANDLTQHVSTWGFSEINKIIPAETFFIDYTIQNHNDALYSWFLYIGLVITLASFVLLFVFSKKRCKYNEQ